jgi:hypothetical protein
LVLVSLLAACTGSPARPNPTNAPATSSPPDTGDAAIAALINRPLRLPTVAAGAACPVSGVTVRSPVVQPADARGLGTGPLYPITFYIGENGTMVLGGQTRGPGGLYELKVVWATSGGYRGPAVVRVERIDGPGRGYVRLYYDVSAARGDVVVFPPTEFPSDFPASTNVSGPGCWAYQIDGAGLEEVIVFRVLP